MRAIARIRFAGPAPWPKPSRHCIGLGRPVHDERPVGQLRRSFSEGDEAATVEHDVLVHASSSARIHLRMTLQHGGELTQLLGEYTAPVGWTAS